MDRERIPRCKQNGFIVIFKYEASLCTGLEKVLQTTAGKYCVGDEVWICH